MKSRSLFLGILLGAFSFLQALPVEPILSTDVALKIAQNALKQCKANGYSVAVSILDKSGLTLVSIRDEKAGPHTLEGSYKKAFTSVSTKTPTSILVQKIKENKMPLELIQLSKDFAFVSGGLPIKSGNFVIGAIGVGGAPGGDLDEKCAQTGIQSVAKDLK